jgi:hypothetical protein
MNIPQRVPRLPDKCLEYVHAQLEDGGAAAGAWQPQHASGNT